MTMGFRLPHLCNRQEIGHKQHAFGEHLEVQKAPFLPGKNTALSLAVKKEKELAELRDYRLTCLAGGYHLPDSTQHT